MGHSRAEKERTHECIVALAAKRFREKGVDGIGIRDLMKESRPDCRWLLQAFRFTRTPRRRRAWLRISRLETSGGYRCKGRAAGPLRALG
jgi:hypothetical protein